ncbi:hypothetical protein E3U43_017458 [Larimichthys crocea]|uniref:Uncharacterized protein n=1 Tax=Larimichthys crocea TaxID=215358 RepID=A0ACD3QZD9_LARCR|nr:hypothetical protein E3U43_017458 [Larimichthys crocea]
MMNFNVSEQILSMLTCFTGDKMANGSIELHVATWQPFLCVSGRAKCVYNPPMREHIVFGLHEPDLATQPFRFAFQCFADEQSSAVAGPLSASPLRAPRPSGGPAAVSGVEGGPGSGGGGSSGDGKKMFKMKAVCCHD